jgi:serine protease Do
MRNVPVRSLGTGFLINDQGYALTNYHVIRHATKIRAELRDKRVFEVKVVGKAPFLDLALIKLEAKQATKFPFVYLGDSEKLRVGEPVIAIGNAKGLGLTVTAGILSARGRVLGSSSYDNYLQTDAAINQGNSGGPLFNRNGEVVGINTAILRGGRGIGFAIPINIARHVLPQLIKKGKVERAQLGVFVQAVTPELAQAFGLDSPKGALVSSVMTGSPAAKAGIAAGDIILKVNDKDVRDHNHLPVMIAFRTVGEKLNLTILRKRKQQQVEVTLQPWSDSNQKLPHSESDNGDELDTYNMGTARLGLSVTPISPEIRKQLNLPANTGVLVASVNADGLARQYGIQRGDIILEVNQNTVRSVKQLHSMLSRIPKGGHILLRLQRRNSSLFIAFPLP